MSHKPPPAKISQITINQDEEALLHKPPPTKDCKVFLCFIVIVTIGISLLYFGISRASEPSKPMEFIIADASVTQFNLTSDGTLYYNFKLNITERNPDYDSFSMSMITITAISSYKGNKFAVVDMEPFSDSKNTILKPVLFYGNSSIKLNAQQLMEYDNETRLGKFNLDLKLNFNYDEYAYCIGLGVPLISNEKLESTFNVTKCSREYQGWS